MTDDDLRICHAACVAALREGESYAAPIPTVLSVRIALGRARIIADRDDVVIRCRKLSLVLADV